jgi:hypothetical protein
MAVVIFVLANYGATILALWAKGYSYTVHASPQGNNRVVVFYVGMIHESTFAYPMVNRWVYRETDAQLGPPYNGYTVEWLSEQLAIVEAVPEDERAIIIEFE